MKDTLGALQELVPGLSGRVATTHGGEYHAPCPFTAMGRCDSQHDGFIVWPYREDGNPTVWYCRKHRDHPQSGDLIELVRLLKNLGYHAACDWLEIEPEERSVKSQFTILRSGTSTASLPNEKWQERARELCATAIETLWDETSDYGQDILAYLRTDRGLSDTVIRALKLGAIEETRFEDPVAWGLPLEHKNPKVKVPAGILLPCLDREKKVVWGLVIRREQEDIEYDPSGNTDPYWAVKGSSNFLYIARDFQPEDLVIMVESYLDADSILDVMLADPDLVDFPLGIVATRTTTGCRTIATFQKLSLCKGVLQAFDDDPGGDEGAAYWVEKLHNNACIRWSPGRMNAKDVNEGHAGEANVAAWLKEGLRTLLQNPRLFLEGQNEIPSQSHQNEADVALSSTEYICVHPGCQTLLGPYQRLSSGMYCITHLWDAPELQNIPRYLVTYKHNVYLEQLMTCAISILAEPRFAEPFLCFACTAKPTYMDCYGRVWCQHHAYPGCAEFGAEPMLYESLIEEENFVETQKCWLCEQDDLTILLEIDDHGMLWCAKHGPYISWSLAPFFRWILREAKRAQKEQQTIQIQEPMCYHKNCTQPGQFKDVTGHYWCLAHGFAFMLLGDGDRLNYPKLWVPATEYMEQVVPAGSIESGQERWLECARNANANFLFIAQKHAWQVIRKDVENTAAIRYPCARAETVGCKHATNTKHAYMDDEGVYWCAECTPCARLLAVGMSLDYPHVPGANRWVKGHMILLQGKEEYEAWAYTMPVQKCSEALKALEKALEISGAAHL